MKKPSFMAQARRLRQRGLSLIEAAMVLAIAALVVAGIMLFFQNANNAQKTNEAMQQLAATQQVVRALYSGQPDYSGLTAEQLAQSRQLPQKMVTSTNTLKNAFNGNITIATGGTPAGSQFVVTFAGLPVEACTKMASMDLGTGLASIKIKGATTYAAPTRPTVAQVNTDCGTTNDAFITWTFF